MSKLIFKTIYSTLKILFSKAVGGEGLKNTNLFSFHETWLPEYALSRLCFDLTDFLSFVFSVAPTHQAFLTFKKDIPPCCLGYAPLKFLEN